MRILMTGGEGFIGKNLIDFLFRDHGHHEVCAPSRQMMNMTQAQDVRDLMDLFKPEVVIHLAANPNNKPNDQNPNDILYDNILGTHNLLYYAPKGCRFIFASTICVYGPYLVPPTETALRMPTSVYGATKSACEDLINVYTSQGRICGVSIRLCATVGTGLTHGILYDFIKKAHEPGDYLEVFGDEPGSIKPYIHVADVLSAITYMIDNPYITYPVNILPNGLLSVRQIANMVIKEIAPHKKIKWLGSQSVWRGDQQKLEADNTLAKVIGIPFQYPTSQQAMQAAILMHVRNGEQ